MASEAVTMPASSASACTECRRRKLRCSKELPTCKECRRLRACYRLEELLKELEEKTDPIVDSYNQSNLGDKWSNNNGGPATASEFLDTFERDLKRFKNSNRNLSTHSQASMNYAQKPQLSSASTSPVEQTQYRSAGDGSGSRKRRRLDSQGPFSWGQHILGLNIEETTCRIGLQQLLEAILGAYFLHVHPWIPMIHEATFRDSILKQAHTSTLEVILRAIVVAGLRFVDSDIKLDAKDITQLTQTSREWVILNAINGLSVENLQALTIIAFDDIGNGNANKIWSIIGSLTRTVEYLQLSIEVEANDERPLLKPCPLLPISKRWTETEERRRVFWNVFNLDRFCSVLTGWNTSLTSDDVHRCLPVDGILWRKGEPVLTPFFGIWDKSAGKIGNSIAFLPTHYPSPTQTADRVLQSPEPRMEIQQGSHALEKSTIGAFAYCIEATESMSRVTTYFLQQKINLQDQNQVGSWLTRFKELDLRLVHWKNFLPQKWKNTNVSQKPAEIIMDPNLTLAHITHNASMILLHQLIAYPDKDWVWAKRLPSKCSADTCLAAAIETASISENYLASPTRSKIVPGQFVFCVYVAARILLVHWRYYGAIDLLPDFARLLHTLDALSSRWKGLLKSQATATHNLAGKYATVLRNLRTKCIESPKLAMDVLGYINELQVNDSCFEESINGALSQPSQSQIPIVGQDDEINRSQVEEEDESPEPPTRRSEAAANFNQDLPHDTSCTGIQAPASAMELLSQPSYNMNAATTSTSLPRAPNFYGNESRNIVPAREVGFTLGNTGEGFDDFNSLSEMFFDQQYMDMDRIISFDDGVFSANLDWWSADLA